MNLASVEFGRTRCRKTHSYVSSLQARYYTNMIPRDVINLHYLNQPIHPEAVAQPSRMCIILCSSGTLDLRLTDDIIAVFSR